MSEMGFEMTLYFILSSYGIIKSNMKDDETKNKMHIDTEFE